MRKIGEQPAPFSLPSLAGAPIHCPDGKPTLLFFFETDCPTCRLTLPYLNHLSLYLGPESATIIGISQDDDAATREFAARIEPSFPLAIDRDLAVSRQFEPPAVPTLFLLDGHGKIARTQIAFDKSELNVIANDICEAAGKEPFVLALPFDGNPSAKPGCASRHLEPITEGTGAAGLDLFSNRGARSSLIELADDVDPIDYCLDAGFDPLPVIPPTKQRVEQMLRAVKFPPDEVIARVPPNYGAATVEKIGAGAVMAGCPPEMMPVLVRLIQAACDERFNLHGCQATTHFAAPLIIINGPVRHELGFVSSGNVFSNVARANSALGRAFQLILTNIGGARPGEIDMSTLGNPGKFSSCIAENEEENPWDPLHVELGFKREQSAMTLFSAEPPRGVSEHNARTGRTVLKAISRALATVWTYRMCGMFEAFVIFCPEHAQTLRRDGFTKEKTRDFLFNQTGIPLRAYDDDDAEGAQFTRLYEQTVIDGEPCYRKFARPDQIKIVVAGGTAGKFSAVIGSWATGPRGSQSLTYPLD
jgi:peroxiredoxin